MWSSYHPYTTKMKFKDTVHVYVHIYKYFMIKAILVYIYML